MSQAGGASSGGGLTLPVTVPQGGTGAITFTDHSLILGHGAAPMTALGAATNGQIPIGSTGANPVLATITAGGGIGIANGAGTITISTTGTVAFAYTPVTFVMSPYAALGTDYYLGVNTLGGPVTVQLPNAPAIGRVYQVADASGNAAINAITVTTVGGIVLINGAVTFPINFPYGTFSFIFNGASYEVF